MSEKLTPLMRQYQKIKEKYPGSILLFRMGDFFETFEEDAVITSQVCGIVLTKRNNGGASESPLAGFPHHQLDSYLPKLVRAGYRVAVCEQLEDPKYAKGIVKRGVIEVVTPGVAIYDKILDSKRNNYVASIYLHYGKFGPESASIAAADISTGEFITTETEPNRINEILLTLNPAELVISKEQKEDIENMLKENQSKIPVTKLEAWNFEQNFAREELLKHFGTQSLKGFGIENLTLSIIASGAILHYISETQQGRLGQIKKISIFNPSGYMILDNATRRNLEITMPISGSGKDGTLISILDKTSTPMGGRMIRKWISMPLTDTPKIRKRLDSVGFLIDNPKIYDEVHSKLNHIGDLERLISKICIGRATPRDLVALKFSLTQIPGIKKVLSDDGTPFTDIGQQLSGLTELTDIIGQALADEPSLSFGNGNIFRKGYFSELDSYIDAKYRGKSWIEEFKESEREKTSITTLKVSYNSVFGYYIEVSKLQSGKVPDYYIRKQTLTNAERYTTPELKEIETKILSAEEKITELEQELFNDLRIKVAGFTGEIQANSILIATIDCFSSFAKASQEYNYVKPDIAENSELEIIDGRHPVVERLLPLGTSFNPNSTRLDTDENQIHIITGPNMSGKSCYLRQTALIVLMAQIGCFVPAQNAKVGIVDRIFTRVGAQDNITSGESTFLVEMQEAANILNNATRQSLIILDELGRGTATFDGISIAWSVAEYLHNYTGARTLFATHYHELNDLAAKYQRIRNYRVEVIEAGSTIIFTHNVREGSSDHSFGIHVARLAGLPHEVIERANEIMARFETDAVSANEAGTPAAPLLKLSSIDAKEISPEDQLSIFEIRDDPLREQILNLKINVITPVQALQILSDMQKSARKRK